MPQAIDEAMNQVKVREAFLGQNMKGLSKRQKRRKHHGGQKGGGMMAPNINYQMGQMGGGFMDESSGSESETSDGSDGESGSDADVFGVMPHITPQAIQPQMHYQPTPFRATYHAPTYKRKMKPITSHTYEVPYNPTVPGGYVAGSGSCYQFAPQHVGKKQRRKKKSPQGPDDFQVEGSQL